MSKYTRVIRFLAKMGAADADSVEKLMRARVEEDGGPGSGNFGHAGRPGKKGGSAPSGQGSVSSGNAASSGGPSENKTTKTFNPEHGANKYGGNKSPYMGSPGKKTIKYGGKTYSYDPNNREYNGRPSMKEPPSQYERATRLSPVHEKRSLATRDNKTLQKLQAASSDPESMKKQLDQMKPGSMIRLNENGYSVFEKQNDGSWAYQKYHEGATQVSVDDVIKSAQQTGITAVATPKKGEQGRDQYWDSVRAVANLEPNAGDNYTGTRYTLKESKEHGLARKKAADFPEEQGNASAQYTKEDIGEDGVIRSAGVPKGKLKNGSGVTKIEEGAITAANFDDETYNTLGDHTVRDKAGNLVLTPEREKLHQDIMEETFANADPVPEGEQKVFTMLGGGSAAGKGTLQKTNPELFNQNSAVIDADEYKKRIPEYVDTAFSKDHESAAGLAHEESSALAKRAMQAAFANGFNCTLDGTGDGRLDGPGGLKDKINQARANGYKVEGVYVTCPTELAVERNAARSKTDEYNRLVPEGAVRSIHKKVSDVFEEVAPLMDHVVLYDTNQKPPKKIAECWRGEKIKKYDEKLYNEFLNKGSKNKTKG